MKPALEHVREAWPGAQPGSAIVKYTEQVQADALEWAAKSCCVLAHHKCAKGIRAMKPEVTDDN